MPIKGLLHHLPDVVRPKDTVCYTIEIPNDPWYLRAFQGTFFELASARSWDNDEAHTALEVAQVWLEIALKLKAGCKKVVGGVEVEDMSRFRIDPDNSCILQIECKPDEWETFWDVSSCVATAATQPSPAGDGPGPGQTQQHCLTLNANGKTLLPIGVNGGDVITLSSMNGGWNDGSSSWYCPDGSGYVLGACVDYCGSSGSDPIPSACHMRIIAEIDGVFYDPSTPIIVPVGVTDATCVFQANDDNLADNFGSVSFCAEVKNNTQPTFTHHFDFRTGLHGWQVRTLGVTAPYPSYTPGVGIECTNPSGISGQGLAEIGLNMPGTYNGLVVRYIATVNEDGAGAHGIVNIGAPFDWTSDVEDFPTSDYPDIDLTANFTLPCEALKVNANVSVGVTNVITDVYITGPGADPF